MNSSKIAKYDLEQDVINLRRAGLSYQKIADEINKSGKLPEGENIDKNVIQRFLDKVPELSKELIKQDKKKVVAVVDNSMNIVNETAVLYNKAKNILDQMEQRALDTERSIDPYRFKAISSEMRELLKQMLEIQKEFYSYNNVKIFMEVVMDTVKEICPESIPIIIEKLQMSKETRWFGEMANNR